MTVTFAYPLDSGPAKVTATVRYSSGMDDSGYGRGWIVEDLSVEVDGVAVSIDANLRATIEEEAVGWVKRS